MTVQHLVPESTGAEQRLNDVEAKRVLQAAGLTVAETKAATSADEAVAAAQAIGYPVLVKPLAGQDIPAQYPDGVRVVAASDADVRRAFDAVKATALAWDSSAARDGIGVQKAYKAGVELRVHVFQDPILGPAMALSFGRQAADVWEDIAYRVLPLVAKDARIMLREPKAAKALLQGYGVLPAPNAARIEQALLAISALVEGNPDILDLEIDPAVAGADSIVIQEARITRK